MAHRSGLTRMFYGIYEFMPVPMFSWGTELVQTEAGDGVSLRHTLEFTGQLLESDPGESGVFPYMMSERQKMERALTASGAQEWKIFYDGAPIVSGVYPRITNVNFEEGQWVNRVNYTFAAIYDEALPSGSLIKSFEENWQFEEQEDRRTYKATHDVSAVGINTATVGSNAITNARSFVAARLGWSKVPPGLPAFVQASGSGLGGYEALRSENANVAGGSYGVTELFTISSGNFTHTNTAQFGIDANGITTINIDGTIQGLGRGDVAYNRAFNAWNSQVRPSLPGVASGVYSAFGGGGTLYTSDYESLSITKNLYQGSVTYSLSYSDDATNNKPSGIQEYSISVQDDRPQHLYASFAIMERAAGNIVQDIGTTTEGVYTVGGSVIGKQGYPFANVLAFAESLIATRIPTMTYEHLRMDKKSITKDTVKNTVTFSISWIYTQSVGTVGEDYQLD